ncbi:MAG: pyruvate dehydrogenase (acetyl-transferring) E1 component subunit alpha [Ardenticatenales bacterium]|nr:pyruvate dehydrogenase (acetyl-transferring) E1 component subunit alpha [Ardenticatenales bacterium]
MAAKTAKAKKESLELEMLLEWYRQMALIRVFETNAEKAYQEGNIAGYHHVYTGQEAVAVGTFAHLEAKDHIVTHYRDHGHALARGIDPKRAMAELWGKATGTSKGKGGSMHLASRELNFWGGYAIVAAHISLATGIALAEQYRGTDSVTLCIFGDGSTNNGYFHESLNLAAIWELPILFLCENNLYGMWTPAEEVSAVRDMTKKAAAYDIPAKQIDGMNVLNVYQEMQEAIAHIRSGKGPYFVEALTYRYRGHGAGDIEAYRTKEEVGQWREKDPIVQMSRYLTGERGVPEARLEELQAQVEAVVAEAVQFAAESPEPEVESLWQDIYAKPFPDSMSHSQGRS